jgi:hypothetical protein
MKTNQFGILILLTLLSKNILSQSYYANNYNNDYQSGNTRGNAGIETDINNKNYANGGSSGPCSFCPHCPRCKSWANSGNQTDSSVSGGSSGGGDYRGRTETSSRTDGGISVNRNSSKYQGRVYNDQNIRGWTKGNSVVESFSKNKQNTYGGSDSDCTNCGASSYVGGSNESSSGSWGKSNGNGSYSSRNNSSSGISGSTGRQLAQVKTPRFFRNKN